MSKNALRTLWACGLGLGLTACGSDSGSGRPMGNVPPAPRPGAGGAGSSAATGGTGSGFGNPTGAGRGSNPPTTPGTMPRPELCEVVHLSADPTVPDMMIVLDRSGSMQEAGRWTPSVSAVRSVTMQLDAQIRFGLALFPDPDANPNAVVDVTPCFTSPDLVACLEMKAMEQSLLTGCAPGKVVVPVGDNTAAMVGQVLSTATSQGGTPTSDTLKRVLQEFVPLAVDPDAKPRQRYVLLVTDGQPTCPAGLGSQTLPADIDASNSAIDALTARGVKTYVIGYDTTGAENATLAQVLDGFAMRGGTGDTQHRPVEDEQSLLTELQSIVGAVAGCSFSLDKAPPRAEFVLVRLDGRQINLGTDWQLSGDRTIEIIGQSCETLKDGNAHAIDAEVRCEVVVPE
jgi:hypothetical protein